VPSATERGAGILGAKRCFITHHPCTISVSGSIDYILEEARRAAGHATPKFKRLVNVPLNRPKGKRSIGDGPVRLRRLSQKSGADIRSLLSLAKYERASEDDYGQRMIVNGLALVVTVALIATGVLLASNLHD
jgi:hypothetical protein